mmetsp:Transcript_19886/g.40222  ORF Transcript_19886/g.40222 Transcript_19886/m.40222 type:complete len:169 (-) Transcript_19886:305-811(-)
MGACACASDREGFRIGNAERYMEDAMRYCDQAFAKEFEMRKSFPYLMDDIFDESKSNSKLVEAMPSSSAVQGCKNKTLEMRLINDEAAMQKMTDDIWNRVVAPNLRPKLENEWEKHAVDKCIARERKRCGFDSRIQHKLLSLCVGRVVNGMEDVATSDSPYELGRRGL